MKIQTRHYDKIMLVSLEDAVTDPDLIQTAALINTVASKLSHVIIDAHLALLENRVEITLMKLKVQYEKSRIKVKLVSPTVATADHRTLVEALDAINTHESSRITELFAKEYEFNQLNAANCEAKAELVKILELTISQEPVSAEASPAVAASSVMDLIKKAFSKLEEKHQQLSHMHNTLSTEIEALQNAGAGEPIDPESLKRILDARAKALAAIETSGVFK